MARTKKAKDYRALKKLLNKYHQFSFQMPRRGKDFTPQQKAAITRQANKLGGIIDQVGVKKRAGLQMFFIKKKKGVDYSSTVGFKTNKGWFVEANEPIKANKISGINYTRREFGAFTFFDFKLPKKVLYNPDILKPFFERVKNAMIKRFKNMDYNGAFYLRKFSNVINPANKLNFDMLELYLMSEQDREAESESDRRARHNNKHNIGAIIGFTLVFG